MLIVDQCESNERLDQELEGRRVLGVGRKMLNVSMKPMRALVNAHR